MFKSLRVIFVILSFSLMQPVWASQKDEKLMFPMMTSMDIYDLVTLKQQHVLEALRGIIVNEDKQLEIVLELLNQHIDNEKNKKDIGEYYTTLKEVDNTFLEALYNDIDVDILAFSVKKQLSF